MTRWSAPPMFIVYPSRWLARLLVLLAALTIAAACARRKPEQAVPKTYADAVAEVERLAKTKGHAALSDGEVLDGILVFETAPKLGPDLVRRNQDRLRSSGAYLFLYDHGFGARADVVGITATTDQFEVVRRVRTDGANYGHDNAAVVAWLEALHRDEPLNITGAGNDFVEGAFRADVKDRASLARRIHAFCPDFVNQGLGLSQHGEPHALIERYFASHREFFFWWD